MRRENVSMNVSGYFGADIRGPRERQAVAAIEQNRADDALLSKWTENVRQNPKERRRLQRQTGAYLVGLRGLHRQAG